MEGSDVLLIEGRGVGSFNSIEGRGGEGRGGKIQGDHPSGAATNSASVARCA